VRGVDKLDTIRYNISLPGSMGDAKTHASKKSKIAGQRSRKLDRAFHSTVKYALKGIPMDEFETYFPHGLMSGEVLGAAYDAYSQVRLVVVVAVVAVVDSGFLGTGPCLSIHLTLYALIHYAVSSPSPGVH
jgi:hypothetical protein